MFVHAWCEALHSVSGDREIVLSRRAWASLSFAKNPTFQEAVERNLLVLPEVTSSSFLQSPQSVLWQLYKARFLGFKVEDKALEAQVPLPAAVTPATIRPASASTTVVVTEPTAPSVFQAHPVLQDPLPGSAAEESKSDRDPTPGGGIYKAIDERVNATQESVTRLAQSPPMTVFDANAYDSYLDFLSGLGERSLVQYHSFLSNESEGKRRAIHALFVCELLRQKRSKKAVREVVASMVKWSTVYFWDGKVDWLSDRVMSLLRAPPVMRTTAETKALAVKKLKSLVDPVNFNLLHLAAAVFYDAESNHTVLGLKQRCIFRALIFLVIFGFRPCQANQARDTDNDHALKGADAILVAHKPSSEPEAALKWPAKESTIEAVRNGDLIPVAIHFIIGTSKSTRNTSRTVKAASVYELIKNDGAMFEYMLAQFLEGNPTPDREFFQGIPFYGAPIEDELAARFNRDDMTRMLKAIAAHSGLDPDTVSLKSIRVGKATSTTDNAGTNPLTGVGLWTANSPLPQLGGTYNRNHKRPITDGSVGVVTRGASFAMQVAQSAAEAAEEAVDETKKQKRQTKQGGGKK